MMQDNNDSRRDTYVIKEDETIKDDEFVIHGEDEMIMTPKWLYRLGKQWNRIMIIKARDTNWI